MSQQPQQLTEPLEASSKKAKDSLTRLPPKIKPSNAANTWHQLCTLRAIHMLFDMGVGMVVATSLYTLRYLHLGSEATIQLFLNN